MGTGQIDVERVAERRLGAARAVSVKHPRIVLLGDSLSICRTPPDMALQTVGMALRAGFPAWSFKGETTYKLGVSAKF